MKYYIFTEWIGFLPLHCEKSVSTPPSDGCEYGYYRRSYIVYIVYSGYIARKDNGDQVFRPTCKIVMLIVCCRQKRYLSDITNNDDINWCNGRYNVILDSDILVPSNKNVTMKRQKRY